MLLTAVILFLLFAVSLLIKTPNQEKDSLYWPIESFFIGVGVYSAIPFLWIFSNSSMRWDAGGQTLIKLFHFSRSKLARITNMNLRQTNKIEPLTI